MRTIVDLPDEQIRALDAYSKSMAFLGRKLSAEQSPCFFPNARSGGWI